jgi:dTDP-4-dehydrorhamnose reductase
VILVTGSSGQLGYEIRRAVAPLGPVTAVDQPAVRLDDPDAIRALIRAKRPRVLINTAAYTAVDAAEDDPDAARAVNAVAPAVMAEELKRIGGALVHYSTDYVFDGTKAGPYAEADAPRPLGVYGATKLAGDQAVLASGVPHLLLRTSWIYGSRGKNFVRTILNLVGAGKALRVVDDQLGAPTWSRMLAETTALVLGITGAVRRPDALRERGGLFNLTNAGATTWHGFAAAVLALAPPELLAAGGRIAPVTTAEYPTRARRPANSRLDCGKIRGAFDIVTPDWEDSLRLVMEELYPPA